MDPRAGIGITDEHLALRDAVRGWAGRHSPAAAARAVLDADVEALPPFWGDLAAQGWLGLAVSERAGGEGFSVAEVVVVAEELGRAGAPGPFLPSCLAATVLDRVGGAALRPRVADLVAGRSVGTVAVGADPVAATAAADGALTVDGTWTPVLSGALADVLLVPVRVGSEDDLGPETWVVLDVRDDAGAVTVEPAPSLDRTRRVATVGAADLRVPAERVVRCPPGSAGIRGLAAVLLAAECVGVAAWCVATAAEHALVREQFGRPIGQFQGVKHRCADMLCALEQARAATWDAARALASDVPTGEAALVAAVAGALAPDAAYRCAKDCIQVLGGIGFTWDHDAHVHLKRATAVRLLLGGPGPWRAEVARLAVGGVRRQVAVELPAEARRFRDAVRAFLADLQGRDKVEWNRRIADAGYLVPHWPAPWGRDAGPLEQLVVDEEFAAARVRRPHLAVGAWALPTILVHGTDAQKDRWVAPTLRGEVTWCQMFSEPGAGSDLASVATKAVRVDGGWRLTGQKVWTSMAATADLGICLARTDPGAPRHEGIGCFVVDMRSEGVEVRPLRELTGAELFNEVFLADVFVPDDGVVGSPTGGWAAARTTLANERVSMGRGSSMGPGVEALVALVAGDPGAPGAGDPRVRDDPRVLDTLGAVVAGTQSLAAMGVRTTLRALGGGAPGPESSIRKLLGVELDQVVQEVGLELLGPAATSGEGDSALWIGGFLGNRSLSIAGGTSEIQRNVIAERLLGLPRDP
jgi:alkylation response protein AidB-like acyl-CoA dehydrogenase